jgi:hypothetical protein
MQLTPAESKEAGRLMRFVKSRERLFWDVGDLKGLSEAAILERILNYGDFEDCKELLKIIGMTKAAEIFRKNSQATRSNYLPAIKNYFTLYFEKYAPRD